MKIINLQEKKKRRGRLALLAGFLWLTACATPAPVQEMSNARQALQAAEAAGAMRYAPEDVDRARRLLDRASASLSAGLYDQARSLALEARRVAWHAHETAASRGRPGGG